MSSLSGIGPLSLLRPLPTDVSNLTQQPAPSQSDAKFIIDQVGNSTDVIRITTGACVTYGFQTATAFFCSLCRQVRTNNKFISTQLNQAVTLCVADGNGGSVVSERSPQWQAGFVRAGDALPYFDVC